LPLNDRVINWEPFRPQAEKRLRILDAATSLHNDQWRICFKWLKDEPGPSSVEIVDYH
jgi:proteic killer suppression protein